MGFLSRGNSFGTLLDALEFLNTAKDYSQIFYDPQRSTSRWVTCRLILQLLLGILRDSSIILARLQSYSDLNDILTKFASVCIEASPFIFIPFIQVINEFNQENGWLRAPIESSLARYYYDGWRLSIVFTQYVHWKVQLF